MSEQLHKMTKIPIILKHATNKLTSFSNIIQLTLTIQHNLHFSFQTLLWSESILKKEHNQRHVLVEFLSTLVHIQIANIESHTISNMKSNITLTK